MNFKIEEFRHEYLITSINELIKQVNIPQTILYQAKPKLEDIFRVHTTGRLYSGGRYQGDEPWVLNTPWTLRWESHRTKNPQFGMPLVFQGYARQHVISNIVSWIEGNSWNVATEAPVYMIYQQYGYTTRKGDRTYEVPARPWFGWATVDGISHGEVLKNKILTAITQIVKQLSGSRK